MYGDYSSLYAEPAIDPSSYFVFSGTLNPMEEYAIIPSIITKAKLNASCQPLISIHCQPNKISPSEKLRIFHHLNNSSKGDGHVQHANARHTHLDSSTSDISLLNSG
ncbi:unnamed protein product [Protopolystoma xenopodis]|uniref:Uncharacterized protein n=1 Tax=Protopolystoma xenopodis TaxID=117903 RepID=A0A3S5A0A8_9PLAT|nr:unnamed protein product [Protopolystoma xenopodis]